MIGDLRCFNVHCYLKNSLSFNYETGNKHSSSMHFSFLNQLGILFFPSLYISGSENQISAVAKSMGHPVNHSYIT